MKGWLESMRFDIAYTVAVDGGSKTKALASVSMQGIWQMLMALVCRFRGHDLEDEGFAGPDSGCICLTCRRCGFTLPTTWLY